MELETAEFIDYNFANVCAQAHAPKASQTNKNKNRYKWTRPLYVYVAVVQIVSNQHIIMYIFADIFFFALSCQFFDGMTIGLLMIFLFHPVWLARCWVSQN